MVTFIERSFKCSWKRFTLEQHHGLCYRLTMQHSLWRGWKSCDFQNPSNLLDYLDKTPTVNKENAGVVKWGIIFSEFLGWTWGETLVMRRMKSAGRSQPCLLNDYWNWSNEDLFRAHVWHQKYTFPTLIFPSISIGLGGFPWRDTPHFARNLGPGQNPQTIDFWTILSHSNPKSWC